MIQNCNDFHHHVHQILHRGNRVCSLRCPDPGNGLPSFYISFALTSSFRARSQRCVWMCACFVCAPHAPPIFTKTSIFFQTALVKNIALDFVIGPSPSSGNVALPKLPGAVPKSDFWYLNCCKRLVGLKSVQHISHEHFYHEVEAAVAFWWRDFLNLSSPFGLTCLPVSPRVADSCITCDQTSL